MDQYGARNVISYTRRMVQHFLAFRDSPIITSTLRRSPHVRVRKVGLLPRTKEGVHVIGRQLQSYGRGKSRQHQFLPIVPGTITVISYGMSVARLRDLPARFCGFQSIALLVEHWKWNYSVSCSRNFIPFSECMSIKQHVEQFKIRSKILLEQPVHYKSSLRKFSELWCVIHPVKSTLFFPLLRARRHTDCPLHRPTHSLKSDMSHRKRAKMAPLPQDGGKK